MAEQEEGKGKVLKFQAGFVLLCNSSLPALGSEGGANSQG